MRGQAAVDQNIRYATSCDGVRIAYAVMGKGTPVVRASHWLTHLEYELNSPVWRHLIILGMASRHTLVRYDGRGTGLSQRDAVEISLDRWVDDLACIVDCLSLERFVLLGVSQGGAISIKYAARHPERVSHLIIHGAYARGFLHRDNPDKQRQFVELNRALIRAGWGSEHDDLPAMVHLAIHPGRDSRAVALVQRPGTRLRNPGDDGEIRDRDVHHQHRRPSATSEGPDLGHALHGRRARAVRGRAGNRCGNSRRQIRPFG